MNQYETNNIIIHHSCARQDGTKSRVGQAAKVFNIVKVEPRPVEQRSAPAAKACKSLVDARL